MSDLAKGASMICFATSAWSKLSMISETANTATLQIEFAKLRKTVLADLEGGEFVVWRERISVSYIPILKPAAVGKSPAP